MSDSNISIEVYSDKSFVVRGETIPYKESLKSMGGKWNSSLTDKKTGEKFGAWLFWSDKRHEVGEWFKNGCQQVAQQTNQRHTSPNIYQNSGNSTTNADIKLLHEKLDYILVLLQGHTKISQKETVVSSKEVDYDIEDDFPETTVPVKRLIRQRK